MKVLFIANEGYPYKSATSNCIREIAGKMLSVGFEVGLINITGNNEMDEELEIDKVKVYNVHCENNPNIKLLAAKKQYFTLIRAVLIKLIKKYGYSPINSRLIKRIQHELEKYGGNWDVFVPVCSNVHTALACMEYCIHHKRKYVLYQVDPIETNKTYKKYPVMADIERQIYKNASFIITTPIIAEEKKGDSEYDSSKIIPLEFPNVRNLTVANIKNNSKSVVCFYSGRFYSGVRDCNFALSVLARMQNKNIRVVFAGTGQEDVIAEYGEGELFGRLTHIGEINLDDSLRNIQQADILLNIGNKVVNQVPSKIFDYISTGKPVVNFCSCKECPTIPYMNKYGNAINIIEGEQSLKIQAQLVESFIQENMERVLTYKEIETKFHENTVDFVGNEFINVINNTTLR